MEQEVLTKKHRAMGPLKNQRGQMAIFIALFFQVLFVFFAMAINVGLVVHDKINLQNAVDLAVYYGAAKQAEVLNQIAHINYQMRQNYKLFVWRYRILGTIGLKIHPLNTLYDAPGLMGESASPMVPSVCVANYNWQEYLDKDPGSSFCSDANVIIPNIKPASGGGGFVPGYSNLVEFTKMANRALIDQCLETGIFNWLYAARMLTHLRVDGLARKKMILKLAQNLNEGIDIRGDTIEEGVRKTLEKNLTNSQQIQNFQYFNSMNGAGCETPEKWLTDIKIQPVILYTDFEGNINDCRASSVSNRPMDGRPAVDGLTNLPYGFALNSDLYNYYNFETLKQHWGNEPSGEMHSSVGFEKNPWCMVYSGLSATTSVRKPFAPGGAVTLSARGFAKPFGGRIGPWYGKTWAKGSPNSDSFQKVDPLLPSRNTPGTATPTIPEQDIANHSRFPGDKLGLSSNRAITSMAASFRRDFPYSRTRANFAWGAYDKLGGVNFFKVTGDSLARASTSPMKNVTTLPLVRKYELAATVPDVFDAFYYSVEPAFHHLYFGSNTTSGTKVFQDEEKIFDFGSSKDSYTESPENFSIVDLISGTKDLYDPSVDYIVRDWKNLLTSWHQNKAVEYGMDSDKFGACSMPVTKTEYPTTGNCIQGGRTGYSVKSVSRHYLLSEDHQLGGESGSAGSIINTPPF